MQKSFRNTLLSLAVLILLVSWYLIYEKKLKVEHASQDEKTKQIVTLPKEDIQEVEIKKDKSAIKLKRTGADWNLIQPIADEADSAQVDSMLSSLVATKAEETIEDSPKDLKIYGLDQPKLTVEVFKNSQTQPEILYFGDETPIGNGHYVKLNQSTKVIRIGTSLKTAFDKKVTELRNKSVFSKLSTSDIKEIEVKGSSGKYTVGLNEKDQWIVLGDNLPADQTEVQKLLASVAELKATDFLDTSPSGPRTELGSFHLIKKDKTALDLTLIKAADKNYVKRADKPVFYVVDKALSERLNRKKDTYYKLDLVDINRFEVSKLKLETAKDSFEVVREGAGWKFVGQNLPNTDSAKVDTYLSALQDTKFLRYAAPAGKSQKYEAVVRIFEKKDNTEKETTTLKILKKGSQYLVEREGQPNWVEINDAAFKKIAIDKSSLVAEAKQEPATTAAPSASHTN